MSGAACQVIIAGSEINKLQPGHALEACLREACKEGEIARAVAKTSKVDWVLSTLNKDQLAPQDQLRLRELLNGL